jgi:ornithine carbamoyltransferase
MSMDDLSREELERLVLNAAAHKKAVKSGNTPKELSTSTRVSTEAAVTILGGHPMFLGKDDIQLGVRKVSLSSNPLLLM